jgi:FGGY-family pentulose kinase
MNRQYVLGIDFGTSGVRAGIFDLSGNEVIFREEQYELITPRPSYAEQRPDDWWKALCVASNAAVRDSGIRPGDIIGIGTDMTACTMMFLDDKMNPLHNAIMWMDVRAAEQAKRIAACGHPILRFNGFGNVSPEWMPCKTLWVKENLPEVYRKSRHVLSCEDWLGYKLTGRIAKNLNDAAARWYYDTGAGGWQADFFDSIGLGDVMEKIPSDVVPMGETLGTLTKEAADALGLAEGTPVAEGGADAFVAMLALGAVRPGKMAMVTGSSHLFLALTESPIHSGGIFGSFPDAVIQGLEMVEGGQTSTGSVINWYKNRLCGALAQEAKEAGESVYDILNREAEKLPAGSDGLICLDYFQGNRTPYTDGEVRGLIGGLSLMHTPFHIYKALVESICYGTEVIFGNFGKSGVRPKEVYACGGAVKSRFWMQTHADVCNVPINIPKVSEAPALGSAILGAVAGGAYGDLVSASDNMVKIISRIEPNRERHEEYQYYAKKYAELYPMMMEWTHDLVRHEKHKIF